MNTIYIGLSTPKKKQIGSEVIKWGQNTEYSHVYIRRESSKVGEYVYQATVAGGVNFMGIDIFNSDNLVIEEYKFEINNVSELLRFFIKNAGRKYSKKQILALTKIILLRDKLNLDYEIKDDNIDGDSKFICSELGAIVLRDFLNAENIPKAQDLVTPKDLKKYLVQYGTRVK